MTCSNLFHYYRCPRYDKRGYNILRFLIRGKWCIIDFNTFNALNWSGQIFNMYVKVWDNVANLLKNSPIKGWGGLSKMSNKMSKMSIIELFRLGQDLFDFSGLTWATH